jgi:hypothetical protein
MTNNDFHRLTNALLRAYLDKVPSDDLPLVYAPFGVVVGDDDFKRATAKWIEWLNTGIAPEMDKKNRRTVTELGLLTLCDKYGGVLGDDYSQSLEGDWYFKPDFLDKLVTESQQVRETIGWYIVHVYAKNPCEALDEWLGVPFCISLISIGLTRCSSLASDDECYLYASIVASGILERHPQLEYYLKVDYTHTLTKGRKPQLVDDFQSASETLAQTAIGDIMMALGRTDRNYTDEGDDLWSADDLAMLDKVWWGSDSRPALVADEIRKLSEQ